MTAGAATPGRRRPVGPWRRVAARLIDAVTVLTILWVLVVLRVFWFMSGLTTRVQPDPWGRAFVVTVCFVVVAALYEAVFVSHSSGQTPGMDIMNIRVVGPSDDEVGSIRAVARVAPVLAVALVRPVWAALLVLAIYGLDLVRPVRRPMLDTLTGTTVVSFDRDQEDPNARRPVGRHRRLAIAREDALVPAQRASTTASAAPIGDGRER